MTTRTIETGLSVLLLLTAASRAGLGQPMIQFPVSTCTVTEGIGSLEIAVQRQNDLVAAVSVAVATAPLTATPGVDYTPIATNLTFLAGETNLTVSVPILEHGLVGMIKRFQVLLKVIKLGMDTKTQFWIWY